MDIELLAKGKAELQEETFRTVLSSFISSFFFAILHSLLHDFGRAFSRQDLGIGSTLLLNKKEKRNRISLATLVSSDGNKYLTCASAWLLSSVFHYRVIIRVKFPANKGSVMSVHGHVE